MLSKEENELVTRTGPGTPMGEAMRCYWLPAALSSELPEPDCPPIRVRLLGEKLVAFRDTEGCVGLLDEFCAHRRASLFLGRNEECGLRCVYHGWKYDVEGKCVEMPNEPPESSFKEKIHLKAYPTVELGGVVWAYLGPKGKAPSLPAFEWTQLPENHRIVNKTWQESNWLQGLEGGIDNVHTTFLHRTRTSDPNWARIRGYEQGLTAVREEAVPTDYGLRYASIRPLGKGRSFVRIYQYVMPFHQFVPHQMLEGTESRVKIILGHIWVPMDDENCMVYNYRYSFGEEPLPEEERMERRSGRGPQDQTADFRKVRNKDNDWLIDRRAQRAESFTGISGFNVQDHAVQESMGPLVDRTREHLGTTDKTVTAARLLLILATRTVQQGGEPPGLQPNHHRVRAIERVLSDGVDWKQSLEGELTAPLQS